MPRASFCVSKGRAVDSVEFDLGVTVKAVGAGRSCTGLHLCFINKTIAGLRRQEAYGTFAMQEFGEQLMSPDSIKAIGDVHADPAHYAGAVIINTIIT